MTVRKAGLGQRGNNYTSTFMINSALLRYYSRIFSILRRQETHFLMMRLLRRFLGSRWVGNEREMNDLDPQAPSPRLVVWGGFNSLCTTSAQANPSKGCVHFGKIPIAIDSKTQEYHPIAGGVGDGSALSSVTTNPTEGVSCLPLSFIISCSQVNKAAEQNPK